MRIPDFKLERYFARWEFSAPYLLCSSDVEGWRLKELLALADEDSRRRWEELSLGYTESTGLPALREEVAALYPGLGPEHVLTFAGAQEAVFILLNVLLGPGDHAVVTWPAYQSLYEVARAAGAEVTLLPLREESGWALDLEEVRKALRPHTRLLVVNFPHNPTGALPERATFEALCALAEERGVYLLSDEVYRLLEANLARVDAFFARHADTFHWVRPRAGSVAFPRLLRPVPVAEFCRALVEQQGVLLLPGDVYDFPGNHFRLGLGRSNLPEALARLERFCAES